MIPRTDKRLACHNEIISARPWHTSPYHRNVMPWKYRLLLDLRSSQPCLNSTLSWDMMCSPTFRKNILPTFSGSNQAELCLVLPFMAYPSAPNIDEVCFSETSVNNYLTTRHHIPADSTFNIDCSSSCCQNFDCIYNFGFSGTFKMWRPLSKLRGFSPQENYTERPPLFEEVSANLCGWRADPHGR
jgi:hypothetical protein